MGEIRNNDVRQFLGDRRLWILSFIFLLLTVTLLADWISGNDGVGYYAPAKSLVVDGDLDLENESDFFQKPSLRIDGNTEKYYSKYPIGTSITWLPAMFLAHVSAKAMKYNPDGYNRYYYRAVSFQSALMAFVALILIYFHFSRFVGSTALMLSIISVWLCSNLLFYMFIESTMCHSVGFFFVTIFILRSHHLYLNQKFDAPSLFILGTLAGFISIVRLQDIIVVLLPLCILAFALLDDKLNWRILVSRFLILGLGFGLGVLPDLLMNIHDHHTPIRLLGSYYGGSFRIDQWWYFLKVVFSTNHGIVIWTPIFIVGLLGLVYRWNRFSMMLLLLFVAQLILTGMWSSWNGAHSFGNRFFVSYTAIPIIGLAYLLNTGKFNKTYVHIGLAILLLFNLTLIAQFSLRMIPTDGPVDPSLFLENMSEIGKILAGIMEYII